MTTRVQGWKVAPRHLKDEEIVRYVTCDKDATPLERDLALRIEKLLYKCDDLEMDAQQAFAEGVGAQLELFQR